MQSKAFALLCLMVASAACASAALLGGSKTVQTPVIMFDDTDFSGGSQNFPVTLPTNGCSDCENLNFVRTNSWESYVAANGTSIILFDGHGCTGKTSNRIATWGVIPGTLKDSVDSFKLCNEPKLALPAAPAASGRKMI